MTAAEDDILSIEDRDGHRLVPLLPEGTIIGRTGACHVVLDSQLVSRNHARLFRDPFGRWIIEDLKSHNGVVVGGQRVDRTAIVPGQSFGIGPFRLKIVAGPQEFAEADMTIAAGISCLDVKADSEVISVATDAPQTLSGRWMKDLNRLGEFLSGIVNPKELYGEACRCLAYESGIAAIVLRIADGASALSAPQILAAELPPGHIRPTGPAGEVMLSHRVVEAVRTTGAAVLASDVRHGEAGLDLTARLDLTVLNNAPHRSVACVPITATQGVMEALYLEVSQAKAEPGLLDFARAAARQVDFARRAALGASDNARRQRLEQQLAMARKIQDGLIPGSLLELPGVELAVHYEPTLWVGGDYCDVWKLKDEQIAFAIGDVAGKGLPAAMAMANLHAVLRASMAYCDDLLDVVSYANQHIERHLPEGAFVTAIVGTFRPSDSRLTFVNAGHLIPLIVRCGSVSEAGKPLNPPLGVVPDFRFTPVSMELRRDDAIAMFTDGISEAACPAGNMLGIDRLRSALTGRAFPHSVDIVRAIVDTAASFRGQAPQNDDLTVLVLRPTA